MAVAQYQPTLSRFDCRNRFCTIPPGPRGISVLDRTEAAAVLTEHLVWPRGKIRIAVVGDARRQDGVAVAKVQDHAWGRWAIAGFVRCVRARRAGDRSWVEMERATRAQGPLAAGRRRHTSLPRNVALAGRRPAPFALEACGPDMLPFRPVCVMTSTSLPKAWWAAFLAVASAGCGLLEEAPPPIRQFPSAFEPAANGTLPYDPDFGPAP